MKKLLSLQNVNANALPANVLVLMSKYAKALETSNGTVIRLSSLRIFDDIHLSCGKAKDEQLNLIYQELLKQVNIQLEDGLMFTNKEKKLLTGENSNKERILKKYLPQAKLNKLITT